MDEKDLKVIVDVFRLLKQWRDEFDREEAIRELPKAVALH